MHDQYFFHSYNDDPQPVQLLNDSDQKVRTSIMVLRDEARKKPLLVAPVSSYIRVTCA